MNPSEFSVFLHKYDLKRDQIFTQVLKLDKVNPIKHMRKKMFSSFSFNVTYFCVAKVCEPQGLSFHLKGKLESGVSINEMTIQCESGRPCLI